MPKKGGQPRQPAAVKAAIAKTVAAQAAAAAQQPIESQMALEPVAIVAAAPAPSIDPALLPDALAIVDQAAQVAEAAISNARRPHRFADHAKSRDIDSLPLDALRAYGLEIGMSRRDCAELTEQRLRAGCRAHLARHFDELTE